MFYPAAGFAQVPTLNVTDAAATPLIGEETCSNLEFTNTGSATGYGPYLFITLPPGLTITANTFIGIPPPVETVGIIDATGMIADPVSGQMVSGTPGGIANLVRYPVGSVVAGQPALVLNACGVVGVGAEIGVPLEINYLPGFEFGNSSTGDNGPITGNSANSSTITPQLARVTKTANAPEKERPPGPSHPFTYSYSIDVSEGVTILDVRLSDVLPPEIQWTGGLITVSAQQGALCEVITEPNLPTLASGTLEARCAALTGTASENDLTVTLPLYITDILNQSTDQQQSITNTVNFEYFYQLTPYSNTDNAVVTAKHVTVQKSANPEVVIPGDIVTYTVNFQVTDYSDTGAESLTSLILDDTLSDGLGFIGNSTLSINGASVGITPQVSAGPVAGQTSIEFDIAQANGGSVSLGSDGQLTYQVEVLQTYNDGTIVVADDGLGNTAQLNYTHSEGANGSDGSNANVAIEAPVATKTLVSPSPVPSSFAPGDEVTFRLQLAIPSQDTKSISLTDFLPLPVTYVADINPATDITVPAIPGVSSTEPAYSSNIGANSFTLTWPDPAGYGAAYVAADITVTVTNQPFSDGLFLTNLLQATTENNAGELDVQLVAKDFIVGAPELVLTKGVLAVDNITAIITPTPPSDPSQSLADSDATNLDAGDVVTYVITIENLGSQPAWNLNVLDPTVPGLTCAPLTAGNVTDGLGQNIAFTGSDLQSAGGITITGPVAANDANPAGGGAPFTDDTVLIRQTCTVDTATVVGDTLTNTASVTYTSTDASNQTFPEKTDSASVSLTTPTIEKDVVSITPGYAGNNARAQIGELVDYQVNIEIPEGTIPDVYFEDLLDAGLAFVELTDITASAGVTTSVAGGFAGVMANSAFSNQGGGDANLDRLMLIGPTSSDFGFGTITNSNTDNSAVETITLLYQARVLNTSTNIRGTDLNNRARWSWNNAAGRQQIQASAANVKITEPTIEVTKTFNPTSADQGNPTTVQISVQHTSASNGTAFELSLNDLFPYGITPDFGTLSEVDCNLPPDSYNNSIDTLNASWDEFPLGSECTFEVATTGQPPLPAGTVVKNCANADWNSLDDNDLPLPMPPANPLGVERTGNTVDTGGAANTYSSESCANLKIIGVRISKTVDRSDQSGTGADGGVEELAIGEEVTFLLTATLPEDPTTDLVIQDRLPAGGLVLEALSATVLPLPSDTNLSIPNLPPAVVLEDLALNDGIDDTVTVTFGSPITNTTDGITDYKDRIEIEVVARVRNLPINQNLAEDDNVVLVRFGDSLEGTDTARVRAVEPVLSLTKSADSTNAEAGNDINYTLSISHASGSRADAFDVTLEDLLPPELTLVPGSLTYGTCPTPPDVTSTGTGDMVSAAWTTIPRGGSCDILYTATVSVSSVAGSLVTNNAELIWKSLDATATTDIDERSYADQGQWQVRIGEPGMTKELVETDIPETTGQQLTIGETATFEITVEFPDGTTGNVSVIDTLPFKNAALELVSATIKSIGSELTIPDGASVGEIGDACSPNCDSGLLGYDNVAAWKLGDVINAPDLNGPVTGAAEQIVFEVQGIVRDTAINQGIPVGVDVVFNSAELTSENLKTADQAPVTIVEPRLELEQLIDGDKPVDVVSANETVDIELTIRHLSRSSAPAFNITTDVTLNAQVAWVDDNTVSSNCPGLVVDSASAPIIQFSVAQLPLTLGACTINYQVQMSNILPVPGIYEDSSQLGWESAPGSTDSRSGEDSSGVVYLTPSDGSLAKRIDSTSLLLTNTSQGNVLFHDLTIGETVTYDLVAGIVEGISNNVFITDTLPNGLEIVAANIKSKGASLTTSFPGTPLISGQSVRFDFGVVANLADSNYDSGDVIRVSVTAQVLDIGANQSGVQLTNDASLNLNTTTRTTQATIDIVAPELSMTKSFGDIVAGRVPITLSVNNTGTAPAYSAVVTDVFDETIWVAGSLQEEAVPDGWKLETSSAGGQTTVTIQPDGNEVQPLPNQILLPGAGGSVTFSMELVAPATVSTVDNTANVTADSLPNGDPAARAVTAQATASLPQPILDASKSWTGPNNPALPGETLTYTIEVENSGDADATLISINDQPDLLGEFLTGSVIAPGGTVVHGNTLGDTAITVEFADIPAGQTASFSYQVVVPLPYPAGVAEQFVNQAIISSLELMDFLSDDPSTGAVDDATIAPILTDPIMSIVKDDESDVVGAGGTIFYKLDYANIGDQDATGVVITETVPLYTIFNAGSSTAGWSCADQSPPGTVCTYTVGDLGGGQGSTIYFAVTVDNPIDASINQIDNVADITDDGTNSNGVPSTDQDNDFTRLLAAPVLDITKDDGGISTVPGAVVVYQIDYVNNGTRDATGVRLLESVPPNSVYDAAGSLPDVWSCADGSPPLTLCELDVGDLEGQGLGTGQASFAARVDASAQAGVTEMQNAVIITDDGNATLGVPVVALAFDDTPIIALPDLVIEKADSGVIGRPGAIIPYTLSYQQVGNQDATGVFITETVPLGTTFSAAGSLPDVWSCPDGSPVGTTCTLQIGPLAAGSNGVAYFGLQVDDPLPAGLSEVTNTVHIEDDGTNGADPTPANNTDSVATLVTLFPPAGRKSGADTGSGHAEWRMVWFNNLNTTDLPISVYDPIPAGSNFVQGSLSCTASGASQCLSATYNAVENRVEVEAIIAPDFGVPDITPEVLLANEVVISFESTVASSTPLVNVADACWDENNSGTASDDRAMGQVCIVVSSELGLAVAIPTLGKTGLLLLIMLMLLSVTLSRKGSVRD